MLAHHLMDPRAPRRQSPLAAFTQNFQAGMAPGPMGGGEDIWETIGRFLSGQNRRKEKHPFDDGVGRSAEKDMWNGALE